MDLDFNNIYTVELLNDVIPSKFFPGTLAHFEACVAPRVQSSTLGGNAVVSCINSGTVFLYENKVLIYV